MANTASPGTQLKQALAHEQPLQIVGVINAYCGLLAEQADYRAIYLSGAGVSNATLGVPDLGVIELGDVVTEANRITAATDLPLLVDGDTGWGNLLSIRRGVKDLIRAGAAGVHFEDQIDSKRCGHRDGKRLVSVEEMADRIKAAVDARTDDAFMVMARTDAYGVEGIQAAIDRSNRYVEAGADAIFAEAMHTLDDYQTFTANVPVPVLANMTEFGKSPLLRRDELGDAGVAMVLYPLSAFRAMSKAAAMVYAAIRKDGSQRDVVESMQTRDELYDVLNYLQYEQELDNQLGGE